MHELLLYFSGPSAIGCYMLIALGIVLEGDAVLYASGFLAHQGLLDPSLTFAILLISVTFGDVAWYQLGAYLHTKDNSFVRYLKKITDPLSPHLLEHPTRSLFFSKFLYGINHAILCKAGALQLPVKVFMKDNLPANLAWVIIVGGLGFASSMGFTSAHQYVRYGELGLFLGFALFIVLSRVLSVAFKQKI